MKSESETSQTWFPKAEMVRERWDVFDEVVRVLPVGQTIFRALTRQEIQITLTLVETLQSRARVAHRIRRR
jgi:hypothetical protein